MDAVITATALDAQIDELRAKEQAMKREARELEQRVKSEVRPKLYALVELRKEMRAGSSTKEAS